MSIDSAQLERAIAARESAGRRVQLLTGAALVGAAALAGILTAVAAGSSHAKRVVTRTEPPAREVHRLGPVVAPSPPLVSVEQGAPAPSPAPAPSVASPTVAPVVVSGGS